MASRAIRYMQYEKAWPDLDISTSSTLVHALSGFMALHEAVILRYVNFLWVKCFIAVFETHIPLSDHSELLQVKLERFLAVLIE